MKCQVVKLRANGVAIPKYNIPREPKSLGELKIIDTREHAFNRIVKLARLMTRYGDKEFISHLYEPHVLWMAGDRFTLTGFERVKKVSRKSILCSLGCARSRKKTDNKADFGKLRKCDQA